MIDVMTEHVGRRRRREVLVKFEGLAAHYSAEAENAVLGAILANADRAFLDTEEALQPEDFFVKANQILYAAMQEMNRGGVPIEPITLLQFLRDRQLGDSADWAETLGQLAAGRISILSLPANIRTVREKSILRALQQTCAEIVHGITERQHEVEALLDDCEQKVFQIRDRGVTSTTVPAGEVVRGTLNFIIARTRNKGRYSGIPSGFYELDELTTGFKGGEMIVIAARPGVGKTALALSMAKNFLKERWDIDQERATRPGYGTAIFSLEMTGQQLMLRLLSAWSNVRLSSLSEGKLSQTDLDVLPMLVDEIAVMPLFIDESPMLNINQLRAKARRLCKIDHATSRRKIDILIIDYLQLMTSTSPKAQDNRQVEVAEISRGLKALALELNIPIVVLAQLNRKPEETNQEPALHHLRESGSIEQDADVVMLLSRCGSEEEQKENLHRYGGIKAVLNVAKQRNGPTDRVHLLFQREYTRFDPFPKEAH